MKISYYKNKKQPPSLELTESEVVHLIRDDEELRRIITEIRQSMADNDLPAAEQKKGELPAVTFSARFSGGRRYDKLVEYIGEISLDFDKKTEEELQRIRRAVEGCPHTHISFRSPRGSGSKVTVRTSLADGSLPQSPDEVRNYHAHAYDQVAAFYEKLCSTGLDEACKDMTRLCYLSHDDEVYFNPDAQVFVVDPALPLREKPKRTTGRKKGSVEKTVDDTAGRPSDHIRYTPGESRALLATLLHRHDHKETYSEGNRNNYLYKLACTYNCYGIPMHEAQLFIRANFSDLPAEELDSAVMSAYRHTEEFNTRKLSTAQWNFLHIEQYIRSHYDTRYNLVKHRMECSPRGAGTFCELDDQMENTIWMELNEAGYTCNVKNVGNLIYSDFSQSYHPIRLYMEQLPAWDGIDHLARLARSVGTANADFWQKGLTHFLVGMVAAATRDDIVNHLCLLLCSKQNLGKTTFINRLLPPELRAEYLSTGTITPGNKDDLARISQFMLINFDEYEGMNGRELSQLKDLITRSTITLRLPYARRTQNFPHVASFAGTCNYPQVLHDPTGNRRFLCFEVDRIELYDIDYPQLYAQIKHLLDNGYRYWFEADEVNEIESNNQPFIFNTPEEEMLLTHFRKPKRFEPIKYMTVSEIAEEIRRRTGYQYTTASKIALGKALVRLGFEFSVGKNGRRYEVFILDPEQVKSNQLYKANPG